MGEHGQRGKAGSRSPAIASALQSDIQLAYAAVFRGVTAAPATLWPAIASASGGFKLSIIELGIRRPIAGQLTWMELLVGALTDS